ncbi:MAG: YdcF family protein, partial [Leptolyngbya sp. DLM2.Bin15]
MPQLCSLHLMRVKSALKNFINMRHTLAVGILLLIPFLSPLPLRGLSRLLPRSEVGLDQTLVILGRGPERQADFALAAANFWVDHPNLDIFVSGMTDAPEIMRLLKEMGVPETQITGERCSQTTWENGLFSELLLLGAGEGKRIILVTDDLHITRAFLVFRGFGFKVETYPAQLEYP